MQEVFGIKIDFQTLMTVIITGMQEIYSLRIDPQRIKLGNINLGKAGISYKDRFVQNKFTSLDRINEVEFNRYYNMSSVKEKVDQELREINLNLIPIELLNIKFNCGIFKGGE